jgi:hypothetical protein
MEIKYTPIEPRQDLGAGGYEIKTQVPLAEFEQSVMRLAYTSVLNAQDRFHELLNSLAKRCPELASGDVASISQDFSVVTIETRVN